MTAATTELRHQGQVKRMTLPGGWQEREIDLDDHDLASLREFNPPGVPQVRLCFYYRGIPIDAESASRFRDLLEKPAHDLEPGELEAVDLVLGNLAYADVFVIETKSTSELNGKRVLMITGRWLESKMRTWAMFIDADGTGSAVQEIHFIAPPEVYDSSLNEVQGALNSVEWE